MKEVIFQALKILIIYSSVLLQTKPQKGKTQKTQKKWETKKYIAKAGREKTKGWWYTIFVERELNTC